MRRSALWVIDPARVMRCLSAIAALAAGAVIVAASPLRAQPADLEATIARVKPSIVAIGTYERTRSPAFQFRGTGFVVGDGTLIATNAHVLPATIDVDRRERHAILLPGVRSDDGREVMIREARPVARDVEHDLALLKIEGPPLPPLPVGDSTSVREGRSVYFTGFPIGAVLGAHPATHRAIIAAITPIAIPQGRAGQLDAATAKRLAAGAFPVFQLDGTAYPGNSGSPVFEAGSGAVVGVVNMVLVRATKESLLSQPSGIAYAVPAEHLRALISTLR
jgi:S1-C subfamily serine protease